ncbi:MAG: permease [Deltaproteobacteria bacterium]|nr:permease [Deltaproteobacteria bacterium]
MADVYYIVAFVSGSAWHILPFFLVSIVLGAAVNVWDGAQQRLQGILGTHPLKTILVASLLGTLSPFCSCGVVPVVAGMLSAGIPIAPVLAFWIASPLMDPETFVITYAELGWSFAIGRTISAFGLGCIAGVIGLRFKREEHLKSVVFTPQNEVCCGNACDARVGKGTQFVQHVQKLSLYLGKWLLLAFVSEALIVRYIPSPWIAQLLGTENSLAIPIAAVVGIPLYINTFSAVPIIAGLLAKGMAPGAALTFLVAGPATSIPAMIAVTAVSKRRLFMTYVAISLLGSMVIGYLFQLSFDML